ncbi:transposable element tc1 protein [Rutstroemia sp. NJR-2017a WRK4]|nr:transposable element tc1 protein [Rutstroemia sp. NJR-2017a WRK4]
MGRVYPQYRTPTKSRFFYLLERGQTAPAAAKELGIDRTTAWRWTKRFCPSEPERTTRRRLATKKLGRLYTIIDEHINQMIQWITGHYDRRILSLEMIVQEACGIKATYHTLLRAWQRWGYHYHPPDSKPFLSAAQKLARYTFAVKHWDRPAGYWRKGIYTDETVARTNLRRRVKVLRKRGERRRLDCIQFTFNSGRDSIMCWAAIGYNFKSELYFVSTEGQGKGFTQKKYEQQILRGPLAGIFRDRYLQGFFLQDFNKFIDSIPERICKVLARRGAQTPY